jgi:hypothetical protein
MLSLGIEEVTPRRDALDSPELRTVEGFRS